MKSLNLLSLKGTSLRKTQIYRVLNETPEFKLLGHNETINIESNEKFVTVGPGSSPLLEYMKHFGSDEDKSNAKILGDKNIPLHERRKFAEDKLKDANEKLQQLNAEKFSAKCFDEFEVWSSQLPFKLQSNECSRMHLYLASKQAEHITIPHENESAEEPLDWDYPKAQIFVVKHDWESVLGDELKDSEFILPFDLCAFEFKINGRVVIVLADEFNVSFNVDWGGNVWLTWDTIGRPIFEFLYQQIKAMCIVLDAEVADYSVIHQPPKLNQKRLQAGKLPLSDYHVVDLSVRHRGNRSNSESTGRKVRCHYRRGHWMHLDYKPREGLMGVTRWKEHNGKWRTWIRWILVGNPDLGFVDKEYKL